MSRKTLGYVLDVLGVILLGVSLAADALGIGAVAGFGWKQILGAVVGALLLVVGIWLAVRKPA